MFTCIRQRRAGRRERDAYNAKVEKERDEAYRDQMELREKGLGGWDKNSFATQGEDALGGWGGSHVAPGTKVEDIPLPKMPSNIMVTEVPTRVNSPVISRSMTPTIPQIVSPIPQSPRVPDWTGGSQGGMIHNAGNSYSGGYGGNPTQSRSPSFPLGNGNSNSSSNPFGQSTPSRSPSFPLPNPSRSPSFPLSPQTPRQPQQSHQERGYQGGSSGGYQRY